MMMIVVNLIAIDNDFTRIMFETICIGVLVNIAAVVALFIREQLLVFTVRPTTAAGRIDVECFRSLICCDVIIRVLKASLLLFVLLNMRYRIVKQKQKFNAFPKSFRSAYTLSRLSMKRCPISYEKLVDWVLKQKRG